MKVSSRKKNLFEFISYNFFKKIILGGPGPPKPTSAGASLREGAQKLLLLTVKGEWPPVDQLLKVLEKAVTAATSANSEDPAPAPLAGVFDPVSCSL